MRPEALLQVAASDMDLGSNAKIHYSIIAGNHGDAFRIDPLSGMIQNVIPLDREAIGEQLSLTIEARDQGEPSMFDRCVVNVKILDENDNPPRFLKLLNARIREDAQIGDVVFQVDSRLIDL